MCTVSIVPLPDGFRTVCNRDERDARAPALPPARRVLKDRLAVYATDPQGGGTWFAVNDAGIAMAVLNRTMDAAPVTGRESRRSRGLIIPRLLHHHRFADALAEAGTLDASAFAPFRLVIVQGTTAGVVTSDGGALAIDVTPLVTPQLFVSSSLGDAMVEAPRRRLFEELVLTAGDGWLQGQRRFHRHRWPDRPEISVEMSRPGARTVSRSVIQVTQTNVEFEYQPLVHPSSAG